MYKHVISYPKRANFHTSLFWVKSFYLNLFHLIQFYTLKCSNYLYKHFISDKKSYFQGPVLLRRKPESEAAYKGHQISRKL